MYIHLQLLLFSLLPMQVQGVGTRLVVLGLSAIQFSIA